MPPYRAASLRSYGRLPSVVSGFTPRQGFDEWWSVITPEATTNLVTNPSFETGTTGYTANGSSTLTRATTRQRRGAYGLTVTQGNAASSGPRYDISLTSGQVYTFSADVWAPGGAEYDIRIDTNAGANVAARRLVGTGRWQRASVSATAPSTATHRLAIYPVNISNGRVFYTDGWQCEAKAYATTYCDGDQQGLIPNQFPVPYRWTGTPHASTSTRSATTRAGGRVVNFAQFGLTIAVVVGLGMATITHISTPLGLQDGAVYQDTIRQVRTFSLGGQISAVGQAQIDVRRADLQATLAYDSTGLKQPLILRYAPRDCADVLETEELDIVCSYAGGLEGNTAGLIAEDVTVQFTAWQPLLMAGGQEGAALSPQTSVANANAILRQAPGGAWSALSTGMSGGIGGISTYVSAIAIGPDGALYAGGNFTDAGGSGADYIAKWNGSAWSVVGSATALNAPVSALVFAADGTLYAGGEFTNAGGVAAADYIAKWNGSAWSAVGTGITGTQVNALAFAADGTLYAGGIFTDAGGSGADYIAKWNGSSWSALGSTTAINGAVSAIAITAEQTVIVGGAFTNAGGVAAADYIAKWDGSSWSALAGAAPDGEVRHLVYAGGILYLGGLFTTAGGQTVNLIAAHNGAGYQSLGGGITGGSTPSLDLLHFDMSTRLLYVTVTDTAPLTFGGTAFVGAIRSVVWNGSSYTPLSITLPGAPPVYDGIAAIAQSSDGTLYAGFASTGTAIAGSTTTVTNTGSAPTPPVLVINGPTTGSSAIYAIRNETTGAAVYLNLILLAGERAIYNLETGAFGSNYRPDLGGAVLPGSNPAGFTLAAGANTISFLAADSTVTASIFWTPRYTSLHDAPR